MESVEKDERIEIMFTFGKTNFSMKVEKGKSFFELREDIAKIIKLNPKETKILDPQGNRIQGDIHTMKIEH